MAAEAPAGVPEGFYDLPQVPGVPNLASDAMLAILTNVGAADAISTIRRRWVQTGVEEEGDAGELGMTTLTRSCNSSVSSVASTAL